MIVLSQNETREVVLTRDKELPPEQQTTFIFGPPHPRVAGVIDELLFNCAAEMSEFFGWIRGGDATNLPPDLLRKVPFFELFRVVIPATLRGWRNLKDSKGEKVAWLPNADGTGMKEELLSIFGMSEKTELFLHGFGMLGLTEDEAKNS